MSDASWDITRPYDQVEQGLQRVADKLDTDPPEETPSLGSSITAGSMPQTENIQGFSEHIPGEDHRPYHNRPFGRRYEAQQSHECDQDGHGSAQLYSDVPYGRPNAEGEGI